MTDVSEENIYNIDIEFKKVQNIYSGEDSYNFCHSQPEVDNCNLKNVFLKNCINIDVIDPLCYSRRPLEHEATFEHLSMRELRQLQCTRFRFDVILYLRRTRNSSD